MRKFINNLAFCLLLVLLIISLTGCGSNASAPVSTEQNGQEQPVRVITLVGADMSPASSSSPQALEWWGNEIEKRSNGEVKFEYYWSGSLIGAYEQLEAVKTGNIDFTPYYSGYHPDLAPLPFIALMPMLNIDPLEKTLPAADELYRTHPALEAEFTGNNVKYLFPCYFPDAYVWSTKKEISAIADFKGLNFRGFGPWLTFFDALGASPISLPVPEIYDALDRGVIDADCIYLPNATGNSYWEVIKYVNTSNLGANLGCPAVMNLDTWNSLPAHIQEIIEEVSREAVQKSIEIDREFYARDMQALADHKMILTEFSESDIEYMKQISEEKVWQSYIEELEGKGIPARDVFETYLQLLEKYK